METVYDFTLPRGYLDSAGELHRKGKLGRLLQEMYQRINDIEPPMMETVCPDCGKVFKVPLNFTTGG